MKTKFLLPAIALIISGVNLNAQDKKDESSEDNLDAYKTEAEADAELLNLPGDNLDLYATLNLFQKSKTIEDFEAALNDEKTGINNLDLNLDGDVDFIKVLSKKDGDDFSFVLQVDVLEKEVQDVAVILVTKDKKGKVTLQMVGDRDLYGKDYVIEPKAEIPAVTANPAYSGSDAVVENESATVVVVESEPIVQYVYSPVYVPYYSPYYYGYYPPYYRPYPVISVHVYFGRNRYHHNHYYGGHRGGNTVVINNHNSYNNYNRSRNTSNTVNRNKTEGNYKRNNASKRPSTKPSTQAKKSHQTKPQAKPQQRPSVKPSKKPQTKPQAKPRAKPQAKPRTQQARPQNRGSRPAGGGRPRGGRSGGGRRR